MDSLPQWFQAGGVVAFAALVYLEQRAIRTAIDGIKVMMSAVLEYARVVEPVAPERSTPTKRAPTNPVIGE